jgi:hypothetical protein
LSRLADVLGVAPGALIVEDDEEAEVNPSM